MTEPEKELVEILRAMLAEIKTNAMNGPRIGECDRCGTCDRLGDIERRLEKLKGRMT